MRAPGWQVVLMLPCLLVGRMAAGQAPSHHPGYPVTGTVVRSPKPASPWGAGTAPDLHESPQAWAKPQGLDAAYWRGLVVAEPARLEGIRERLTEATPTPYRALLFRPWEDGSDPSADGYSVVAEAMKALCQRGREAAVDPALAQAACWMAAPELSTILQPLAEDARGSAACAAVPRREFEPDLPPWERERDSCREHLVVRIPALGRCPALSCTFHGPGHDAAARWLQERRGIIPVSEYRQRVLAAAPEQQDALLAADPAWRKPVSLEAAAEAPVLLAKIAGMAGIALAVEGGTAPAVHVCVHEARAGDLARAVARLAGWAITRDERGGYRAQPAAGVRDAFTAALPLPLWAAASMAPVENQVLCSDAIQEFWAAARPGGAGTQPAPGDRIPAPTGRAVAALAWALHLDAGARLRPWLLNLPGRDGRVALALYESEEHNFMELATPTVSEVVQGARYLLLRAELGGGAVVRKAASPGPKGGQG